MGIRFCAEAFQWIRILYEYQTPSVPICQGSYVSHQQFSFEIKEILLAYLGC